MAVEKAITKYESLLENQKNDNNKINYDSNEKNASDYNSLEKTILVNNN